MKRQQPLPNFDRDAVAFNVDAVRSFLFTAAQHAFEGMHNDGIAHAPVAVMTGALEMAAQMWMWTAIQQGVPIQKARQTAEREFRTFLIKHSKTKPVEQGEGAERKPS